MSQSRTLTILDHRPHKANDVPVLANSLQHLQLLHKLLQSIQPCSVCTHTKMDVHSHPPSIAHHPHHPITIIPTPPLPSPLATSSSYL